MRMCYGRYKPITADGIKPPTFVERLESALNKHFIPSAVAIRAASEAGTAQPSLVTAETDSAWINENVLEIMEAYKPRLGKVFDYFSQKDRVSKKNGFDGVFVCSEKSGPCRCSTCNTACWLQNFCFYNWLYRCYG